MFISCELCGKRLIYKKNESVYAFRFGRSREESPIVDMEIVGEGKIYLRCLRRNCNHLTVLDLTKTE